ncbi:MAG TPA: hypothetical protein DCL41_04815 [Bdellovibrionales bacterium]|nr:hypothetical protein [Pseudobdellovibrionaceae bacterium]HAG91167.1 hypothetical protein [Bdellovibrionales bacterium]
MYKTISKLIIVSLAISTLAACQGKNPLDRSNDPTKDYGNLSQSEDTYRQLENPELQKFKAEQAPKMASLKQEIQDLKDQLKVEKTLNQNKQSACGRVHDIVIQDSDTQIMDFAENQEKTYVIKVRSYMTDNFELLLNKAPESSVQLTQGSDKYTWNLTWKPSTALIHKKEQVFKGFVTLAFVPKGSVDQNCLNGDFKQSFSLIVSADSAQSTLSVASLPKANIASHQKKFLAQLVVKDPSATLEQPPRMIVPEMDQSGKIKDLSYTCSSAKASNDHNWTFDCVVSLGALSEEIDKAKNGDVLEARVQFQAISQKSGSMTLPAIELVKVVVDEASKVQPAVPAESTPEVETPAKEKAQ